MIATLLMLALWAQAPPQGKQAPKTPREAAPIDLTGDWVSVVTEDWRWRMLLPKKGDYASVPLSAEDVKTLETMLSQIGESTGVKPSVGQLVSVIVRLHLKALRSAPGAGVPAGVAGQDLEHEISRTKRL